MPSARTLEAGRAVIKLSLDDQTAKGLTGMQARIDKVAKRVDAFGKRMAIAGGAVVGAVSAMTKTFIDAGAELEDMAKRTGASAEALSALKFAAEQSGATLDDLGTGMQAMAKFMLSAERGSTAAVDTLGRLGLTMGNLNALDPAQRFEAFADAISRIEDPTMRAALAQKVFGGAGKQLLPLLAEGRDGIQKLTDAAREAGLVMSNEAVAAAGELDDKLNLLKNQWIGLSSAVGEAVAPAMSEFLTTLSDIVAAIISWSKENPEVLEAMLKIGGAAAVAGPALATVAGALSLIAAAPIIAGVGAVAAAVAGIGVAALDAQNSTVALLRILAKFGVIDDAGFFSKLDKFQGTMKQFSIPQPKGGVVTPAPVGPSLIDPSVLSDNITMPAAKPQRGGPGALSAALGVVGILKALDVPAIAENIGAQLDLGRMITGIESQNPGPILDARMAEQQFGLGVASPEVKELQALGRKFDDVKAILRDRLQAGWVAGNN